MKHRAFRRARKTARLGKDHPSFTGKIGGLDATGRKMRVYWRLGKFFMRTKQVLCESGQKGVHRKSQ